jgi:hypothetical protein
VAYVKIALITDIPAAATTVTAADGGTGVVGTAAAFAREDHKHTITSGTAVDVGTGNTGGSGTAMALANHVHAHPALAGDLHTAYVLASGARALAGNWSAGLFQITNLVVETLASSPGVSTLGRLYFNTADAHPYIATS